jgi:hypothetical protein
MLRMRHLLARVMLCAVNTMLPMNPRSFLPFAGARNGSESVPFHFPTPYSSMLVDSQLAALQQSTQVWFRCIQLPHFCLSSKA